MRRREVLKSGLAAGAGMAIQGLAYGQEKSGGIVSDGVTEERTSWVAMLDRVNRPVFEALSQRRLKAVMPVEAYAGEQEHRRQTTYLEALGRALAGIAPWLEHGATTGAEGELRAKYCEWARAGIAAAVDKRSPDYMDFGGDRQTIVDTAFLSLAILRAPRELREKLPATVRTQLAEAMRATRGKLPNYNNWLLFAAMTEACLCALGEPWDRLRVDYALREHMNWYLGDGVYGDGPHFHRAIGIVEGRAALRELRGLRRAVGDDDGIAADHVFGLGEWAVDDRARAAFHRLAAGFQRLAG